MINKLYKIVEDHYFSSSDFNGFPLYNLPKEFDIDSESFRNELKKSIKNEIITGRFDANPHIMAFSEIPISNILEGIEDEKNYNQLCLYPHGKRLKESKLINQYIDRPYTMELAKGNGQLDYRVFDLSVLEIYRNDPRFTYKVSPIQGQICIKDDYYLSKKMLERDKIFLQTFGFAYDDNMNRYVAVFIRYLSDLSPDHQKIWKAKQINAKTKIHPEYVKISVLGSWDIKLSVFSAFLLELKIINEMSKLMQRPNFFFNIFGEDIPKEFNFLLRPTIAEFNSFILLLDKMMSQNINKKFFQKDIPLEDEIKKKDGKVIVQYKNTIQLLKIWLDKYYRPEDSEPVEKMISAFKYVRKLRQNPAHEIKQNNFDQQIFKDQQDIITEAYTAIRTLRLIFANHPFVRKNPPDIPEKLFIGDISYY